MEILNPDRVPQTATKIVAAANSSVESQQFADYVCDGTADNVEIQAALDALPTAGGKVLLLEGTFSISAAIQEDTNNVTIEGMGINATILKRASASDVNILELSGRYQTVASLSLHGNKDNGSPTTVDNLVLTGADYNTLQDVLITHAPNHGIFASNSAAKTVFLWDRVWVVAAGLEGTSSDGVNLTFCSGIYATNCVFSSSEDVNVKLTNCTENTFTACVFDSPEDVHNIHIINSNKTSFVGGYCGGATANQAVLIEGASGFGIAFTGMEFVGNGDSSTTGDIYVTETNNVTVNGCIFHNYASRSYFAVKLIDGDGHIITGNQFYNSYPDGVLLSSYTGVGSIVKNNSPTLPTEQLDHIYLKNTSGGSLAAGDIVIASATGETYNGTQCITTSSQGDDLVIGVATATIADDASGYIQILGKTTVLKVDGTADIAIGDFIGTHTSAGIGMQASAGDTAFAIALEAYTTNDSSGVIDALLIPPRKIGAVV